jgi:hypothetical protein
MKSLVFHQQEYTKSETAERYLCTQRAKHSTLKKEHHILDDIVELRSLHDGIKGR